MRIRKVYNHGKHRSQKPLYRQINFKPGHLLVTGKNVFENPRDRPPSLFEISNRDDFMTEDSRTRLDESPLKGLNDAGATRVAMRKGTNNPLWLLGDHLGSTSRVVNYDGQSMHSEQLYKPWGEKRYPTGAPTLPTTYQFTGQRHEKGLGPAGGEGLYYYGARWYDPALGRFIQADNIIPDAGNSQAFDRYAYVYNNPLKYVDPSGNGTQRPPYGDLNQLCGPDNINCGGLTDPEVPTNGGDTPSIIRTANDPVGLTTTDYQTDVSGLDMYMIYMALGYDLDAFLRIMIIKELGGWWANDEAFPIFKQALVTRFYDWAISNCSSATFNCMMNWWASYSQSAALAYNEIANTKVGKDYWLRQYGYYKVNSAGINKGTRTDEIVNLFYHPPADLLPPANNGGYDIGILSASLVTNPTKGTQYANQIAYFSSTLYDFGSGLEPAYSVILTYCQNSYWNNNQALLPGCSISP